MWLTVEANMSQDFQKLFEKKKTWFIVKIPCGRRNRKKRVQQTFILFRINFAKKIHVHKRMYIFVYCSFCEKLFAVYIVPNRWEKRIIRIFKSEQENSWGWSDDEAIEMQSFPRFISSANALFENFPFLSFLFQTHWFQIHEKYDGKIEIEMKSNFNTTQYTNETEQNIWDSKTVECRNSYIPYFVVCLLKRMPSKFNLDFNINSM